MKYAGHIAAFLLAFTLNTGLCQQTKLQPRIELRLMTAAWSSITESGSFKAELIGSDRIQLTIPRLSFNGDATSLQYLDKLLEKCGMVLLIIELPNPDDTLPVFSCLAGLGPIQVCTVLKLGNLEISQEAVMSGVKYYSDKLVTFNIDLFHDVRSHISPVLRARGLLEIEMCATDITLLDAPRQ